ncbi:MULTISPECIES: DUF4867 family protein, partial [Blautia]
MKIQKVTDPAFRRYGKVLEGYNFGPLLKEMKHTPVPEDVVYVPSAEELECKLCLNGMPVPLLRNCYSIFNGTKYR